MVCRVMMAVTLLAAGGMALGVTIWAPVAVAATPAGPAAGPTSPDSPEQAATVLDKDSFFRWITLSRPAVIVAEAGAAERTTLAGKKIDAKQAGQLDPAMPAKWAQPGFDDSLWPRTTAGGMLDLIFLGDNGGLNSLTGDTANYAALKTGVIALRGKFNATDPAAVTQLKLLLKFRGGVVAYLNGQEIARGGNSRGGRVLTPATAMGISEARHYDFRLVVGAAVQRLPANP